MLSKTLGKHRNEAKKQKNKPIHSIEPRNKTQTMIFSFSFMYVYSYF